MTWKAIQLRVPAATDCVLFCRHSRLSGHADYTVAGDDNGNPVFSIGIANCSRRVGFSKPDCQLRIDAGLAEWDFLQGLPDCLLKRAAGFAGLEINPKTA